MAPIMILCVNTACEFVTAKAETGIAIQLLTSHYEDVHTQKEQFEAFPSFLSLRFCNGARVASPAVFPATGLRPVRLAALNSFI